MEYMIIGICVVLAIVVGVILYLKSKQNKEISEVDILTASNSSKGKLVKTEALNDLIIQMEMFPAEAIANETRLVEITDSKVLAHINNLIPGLAQTGNTINNIAQAVKTNGEVLYRAIIPTGAKLTDSKTVKGAVRGFYRGVNRIEGQANFVAVEMQKNGDLGLDVPNYVDDVSSKVVKIIQSYTGIVNKMVWRK